LKVFNFFFCFAFCSDKAVTPNQTKLYSLIAPIGP